MFKIVLDFFSKHLVIAALLASILWFYGGYQYLVKGKQIVGLSWQFIGVLVSNYPQVGTLLVRMRFFANYKTIA
jgi:hypothetical protein